jgi:hypothetical protein
MHISSLERNFVLLFFFFRTALTVGRCGRDGRWQCADCHKQRLARAAEPAGRAARRAVAANVARGGWGEGAAAQGQVRVRVVAGRSWIIIMRVGIFHALNVFSQRKH